MTYFLDKILSYIMGFGYGRASIYKEVSSCTMLLKKKPSFVVDCGGNKGLYSDEILSRNAECEIFIFETCSLNIEHLNNKFKKASRVTVIPKGVSFKEGELTLYSNKPGSGLASLTNRRLNHLSINMAIKETVQVTTIDAMVPKVSIDILKIDIEGHELDALKGALETLKRVRLVQFEFGGANIDTRTYFQDFFYFFQKHNFTIYRITPLGIVKIRKYNERMERFITTNYIAVNQKFS
jgi:FkbM family methyltransferase